MILPHEVVRRTSIKDLEQAVSARLQVGWTRVHNDTFYTFKDVDVWVACVYYNCDPRPSIARAISGFKEGGR